MSEITVLIKESPERYLDSSTTRGHSENALIRKQETSQGAPAVGKTKYEDDWVRMVVVEMEQS